MVGNDQITFIESYGTIGRNGPRWLKQAKKPLDFDQECDRVKLNSKSFF